jgi:hypothetical protein
LTTFLLLANPNAAAAMATVQYLIEGGEPVTRTYDVPGLSRLTVDAGADPELVNRSFGMIVTFSQPGLAERAMYFGADPLWRGGHASAGATMPSENAYIAEGATGPFFETFVLIANPNNSPVDVNLTFGRQADTPITMTRTIPASSRLTLNLETLDPGLSNTPVSTHVDAELPVIVERAGDEGVHGAGDAAVERAGGTGDERAGAGRRALRRADRLGSADRGRARDVRRRRRPDLGRGHQRERDPFAEVILQLGCWGRFTLRAGGHALPGSVSAFSLDFNDECS